MLNDELLTYLFDSRDHSLRPGMRDWLSSSRRFAAFVNAYHTKIHKKIQTTSDKSSILDLQLEFETAYLLLRERAFTVEYEPLPIGQARGPDFAVNYTTSTTFMAEVTRLRQKEQGAPINDRLADAVCAKLGQLTPHRANVLLVGLDTTDLTAGALRAAMVQLQQRTERGDSGILARHKFRDRADFINQFRRLSEILVRKTDLEPGDLPISWLNPQAKTPLPPKIHNLLVTTQSNLINPKS